MNEPAAKLLVLLVSFCGLKPSAVMGTGKSQNAPLCAPFGDRKTVNAVCLIPLYHVIIIKNVN